MIIEHNKEIICDHCGIQTSPSKKDTRYIETFNCDFCGDEFCQECDEINLVYGENFCQGCYQDCQEAKMDDQLVV